MRELNNIILFRARERSNYTLLLQVMWCIANFFQKDAEGLRMRGCLYLVEWCVICSLCLWTHQNNGSHPHSSGEMGKSNAANQMAVEFLPECVSCWVLFHLSFCRVVKWWRGRVCVCVGGGFPASIRSNPVHKKTTLCTFFSPSNLHRAWSLNQYFKFAFFQKC